MVEPAADPAAPAPEAKWGAGAALRVALAVRVAPLEVAEAVALVEAPGCPGLSSRPRWKRRP